MKATRILYSKKLNAGKYSALTKQAKLLGCLRSETWQRFAVVSGVGLRDRDIRNQWLKDLRDFTPLSANAWKESLRDSVSDIALACAAAKFKVRKAIRRHTTEVTELKRLYGLLKYNKWVSDKYLTRMMRKYWGRGHNHVHNQIIVRADNYTTFQKGNRVWIAIPSLVKGKRIAIPLSSCVEPTGTLRIILRDARVEIHYTIDIKQVDTCGDKVLGIDKGYTEVFVDSDAIHYGEGLGKLIASESDYLKKKLKARNRILQIAKKSNAFKYKRITKNNLGKKKLNKHGAKSKAVIRTLIFNSVHELVSRAKTIIAEDLTSPISGRKFGKNVNRRLSAWTKGVIAEALENVSQRRSSSLHLINASYTSQTDSETGCFTGTRKGDRFYCENGVVYQADENAAKNVLARLYDSEISRWTSYKLVKSIVCKRTDSYRLGLLNQDSSCVKQLTSTESELPIINLTS